MIPFDKIHGLAKESKHLIPRSYSISSNELYSFMGHLGIEKQTHIANALVLLSVQTPLELCKFLGTSIPNFEHQINNPSYFHYQRPKKKGGFRDIFAPSNELKQLQKKLNFYLQGYYLFIKPKEVHGFVISPRYMGKHCNIVDNALPHVGKKYILNIDIKDFFTSIKAHRVKELFDSEVFRFSNQISTALALLTTYKGFLPQGAPSSPVMSNFICLNFDKELKQFSSFNSLAYTRYADDLTFSSDTPIHTDCLLDIICIINQNGFQINQKKLRFTASNRRQTVTGITVNEKVNVSRNLLKQIRAMLHDFEQNGLTTATKKHFKIDTEINNNHKNSFINRLSGNINFVGQVKGKDDSVYLKFRESLARSIRTGYSL